VEAPPGEPAPAPITVRAQSLDARSYFPEHRHEWAQVVYAISGVLTVSVAGRSFVVSPELCVWLPTGIHHRVGTLFGAEFRSLWIASDAISELPKEPAVFDVTPLLRALVVEAASLSNEQRGSGYTDRVAQLILDQLRQASPLPSALPWPRGGPLTQLCEALYADPTDPRSVNDYCKVLGMSGRTFARRFEAEVGMSFRSWRRRMRVFKAIEMLGGGVDVTRTALDLGYGSPSAFIYAFRTAMGISPQAYIRKTVVGT
jgi:AraC-like DNA-binding protein